PATPDISTLSLHERSSDLSFGPRTHHHNHTFGIGRANIVEQAVLPPGDLPEALHRLLHDAGADAVERVDAFAGLEVDVGVLSGRSEEHTSELQSRENLVCR